MLTGQGKWLMVTVIATFVTLTGALVVLGMLIFQRAAAPGLTTFANATATIKTRIDSATVDTASSIPIGSKHDNWLIRSDNPADWFGPDDYPSEALRNGAEGQVRFSLTIDAAGHATSCTVLESSGSIALDEGTCQLASARAELKPLPQTGRPPETVTRRVRWRLAE